MGELILLEGAEKDALTIYVSLFEEEPARAEKFSSTFDRALLDIQKFPEIGKRFHENLRRKLVPGFYDYGIFYVVETSRVVVHAVLNLRQDPDRILERLKP